MFWCLKLTLELLKPLGRAAFIVPRSNISSNSSNNLFKYCFIDKIINLNEKIFEPNASVACVIIILTKKPTIYIDK